MLELGISWSWKLELRAGAGGLEAGSLLAATASCSFRCCFRFSLKELTRLMRRSGLVGVGTEVLCRECGRLGEGPAEEEWMKLPPGLSSFEWWESVLDWWWDSKLR
jgi:hypothetical protein